MQDAIKESKVWIKTDSFLIHNNKPVQLRIHIFNNSIVNSFFSIEDSPNSFCFIPLLPNFNISFTPFPSCALYLQFSKFENIILGFGFNSINDLELLSSHLCKCGIFTNSSINDDLFYQQNLAYLRKIKPPQPISFPSQITKFSMASALSPIILNNEAKEIWEKNAFKINSQFYMDTKNLRISLLTWNVASGEPNDQIVPYLKKVFNVPAAANDIIIIALQEIDMSMKSVVTGNSKATNNWKDYIDKANKEEEYKLFNYESMGGVFSAILIKKELCGLVKDCNMSSKKLGANGILANKAAVILRLKICEASFCFIACHLAPHAQNYEQRNSQWHEIINDLEDSDYVIFMGDLNYRISLDYETTLSLINSNEIHNLLTQDQLYQVRQTDSIIGRFKEPEIKFNPTFKFDPNCDRYDTSQKHRVPSWTDRILVKTSKSNLRIGLEDILYFETDAIRHFLNDSKLFNSDCYQVISPNSYNYPDEPSCICYRSLTSSFSDHRPVQAAYKFKIPIIDQERKNELSKIMAFKFQELKQLSFPKLSYIKQDSSIMLINDSIVWVKWNIKCKPTGLAVTPNEGVLMVGEKIELVIDQSSIISSNENTIEVNIEQGNNLLIKLL